MVNYKISQRESIVLGGRIYPIKSNEILRICYFAKGGTTAQSLTDSSTEADYVVPTGKTFKAIAGLFYVASVTTLTVFEGATADAETTAKYTPTFYAAALVTEQPLDFTIATGKYLVYDTTNSVDSQIIIIGVES